jgi:hypothetical protein
MLDTLNTKSTLRESFTQKEISLIMWYKKIKNSRSGNVVCHSPQIASWPRLMQQ